MNIPSSQQILDFTLKLPESDFPVEEVNDFEFMFDIPEDGGPKRIVIPQSMASEAVGGMLFPYTCKIVHHNEATGAVTCLLYLTPEVGQVTVTQDNPTW